MKTPPFLKDFIDLFFPRLCPVCQRALNRNEENICTTCLHRLPRTGYHLDPLSPMAQLFLGKVPIEKCAAFFFFSTPSDARQLIHHIKRPRSSKISSICSFPGSARSVNGR
ncbi:double zinc ribbon domain-containing protein [uncultured Barnesiella sp.]|uniref:double zinc ribbon domain-containing protein n=1 Tax=uncultured Barnesiella sp. TaxID=584861 RepID=UPI002599B710|nr:double zinc ribbon domain-containing protein [uncultured Barnesiella sp.]